MENRLKIFMMIQGINYSGASKIFLWVAEELVKRGHNVKIFTFDDWMKRLDVPTNIECERHNLKKEGIFSKIRKARKLIKEFQPDVSISFLLDANVYNILACLGLPTKSVVCERNDPYKPHYYELRILKPLFRYADGAVFQLSKAREYYNNIKVPTAIIPNPITQRPQVKLKPISEREDTFVTHGRLNLSQKRHDVLINAFKLFHSKYPNYKLLIYGWGRDEDNIREMIVKLGLNEYVKLMGTNNSMEQQLSRSKFYVFSSDFEGMPNALMEAMSIGLPCISTDCSPGGAAFLIEDGKNGYIVPRGDVKELTNRMCYLADHQEEAEQIGKEATKICDKLNAEDIAEEWEKYLLKIAKRD